MSIYSNITEQDLINLRKLAEQQKEQRALEIKNKILEKTHDDKLAKSLSPITERLDEVNETTKKLVKKSDVEDGNTQTPAIENTTTSQSLGDTLSFMKKSKNFLKLVQDGKEVFWNKTPIIPQGENRVSIKNKEFDIKPNIQNYFTNTKLTTKNIDNENKLTVYDILKNTGFYSMRHTKRLNSARMKDALNILPKEIAKIRNPPLPAI